MNNICTKSITKVLYRINVIKSVQKTNIIKCNNRDDCFVTGQTGPKATSFSKSETTPPFLPGSEISW